MRFPGTISVPPAIFEATLEAAAKKGGPVGEAARLLLERRKTGLRPSGTQGTVN
jgi:hypothetical protein